MSILTRRDALKVLALSASACTKKVTNEVEKATKSSKPPRSENVIEEITSLPAGPWPTEDPFLFCVHHNDQYPVGNEQLGPKSSLQGRQLGMDFSAKDGWSMYHGETVPGFPRHPHRGFETVTVVRHGLVDHADSLGAAARYGEGDVQWLTAGAGINHAEMFPLLDAKSPNPIDFFQIWLNLPRANKMVSPYFSMFWGEQVPILTQKDEEGRETKIRVVAGAYDSAEPLKPPPESWAAEKSSHVAIWSIKMAANASFVLPKGESGANRSLYFFSGKNIEIHSKKIDSDHKIKLNPTKKVLIKNGDAPADILLLQGKPIGEPIARHGPFVMNTREEIQQAFSDYRRTEFGGWPWKEADPVHGKEDQRFARFADGKIERPT